MDHHVSAYQKVTSAEEELINQVDKTQPILWTVSLFPQPFLSWAHEQTGRGGRDGDYAWAQQHGLPLTKADLVTASAEYQISQEQRPTLSPRYDTIPQDDQPATC